MDELKKKKKRSIVHPNNPDNSQRRRWRRPCDNVPSANYLYIVYTNYFSNVKLYILSRVSLDREIRTQQY